MGWVRLGLRKWTHDQLLFESVGGGTRKPDLPEAFTSAVRASLAGNPGPSVPQNKIVFVFGKDAISHCLEGLTCTLQSLLSRHSIMFPVPPTLPYFCANLDELGVLYF